jgi:hypothetical protein
VNALDWLRTASRACFSSSTGGQPKKGKPGGGEACNCARTSCPAAATTAAAAAAAAAHAAAATAATEVPLAISSVSVAAASVGAVLGDEAATAGVGAFRGYGCGGFRFGRGGGMWSSSAQSKSKRLSITTACKWLVKPQNNKKKVNQ